jgi:hypothetical protein
VKNRPARRVLFFSTIAASAIFIFLFALGAVLCAHPPSIEETVQRLARRAAALPHERRMSLVWSNHGAVSEQRAEELKALFATQLEAAQIHVVQGESAPALRVSIEQTPSRIVISASVPGEGATSVVIEEIARALMGSEERQSRAVRLEKTLVWQTDAEVLSAALPSAAPEAQKKMAILTEGDLQIYGEENGNWKLLNTKALPGPRQPQRGARGQLLLAGETTQQVGILSPGRRCEASLEDDSPVACAAVSVEWPSGKLLASPECGVQTWLLKSDATDWTTEDRLLLRNSAAGRESAAVAELSVPGPVQSIGAGADTGSASVVVRNLLTGNYEVYRIVLSCGN